MFGSCLNYVTLRLLGEEKTHDALSKGHEWILSHGSAAAIPQWGKIWLSVCYLSFFFKTKYLLYVHVEATGVPCCLGSIYKIFPYVSCTIFFKKNSDRFDEIVDKIQIMKCSLRYTDV